MNKPARGSLALLASMTLAFAVSSYAVGAPSPAPSQSVASSETSDAGIAAREARLMNWIHVGRMEGWLTRPEARERYRSLADIKQREAAMRAPNGGMLVEPDRLAIDRALRDFAQDLRWTRERNQQHYTSH